MTLLTAERGQALQVGAVLLFGILIVLFTVWQAFVIPDQNERVEFSHNQEVQSEMVELRGSIVSTADATTPTSGSVKLGAQFPTRLLFVNPTPAAGTLQTESVGEELLRLENVTAVAENGTGERLYWNGTNRTYDTTSMTYSPDYRVFQGAPATVYDNTVTYNVFEREQNSSALSEQAIIDGNTITLVPLVGDYSESGIGSVTPDVSPVSTQAESIAIDSSSDGNITLHLPTRLDASQWEQLLEQEENVHSVNQSGNKEMVEITLTEDRYELRMAQVGVGEGLTQTRPAYFEAVEGAGEEISTAEDHTITVEVRDRFNVPQGNINVSGFVNDSSEGEIRQRAQTTDVDGRATFEFDPDASNLSAGENVSITFNETAPQSAFVENPGDNLTVNVTVEGTGGGDDETINPGRIRINSVSGGNPFTVTFNNTVNSSQNWTQLRIPFVSTTGMSSPPDTADISFPEPDSTTATFTAQVGGGFKDINPNLKFEARNASGDRNLRDVEVDFGSGGISFFVMTVVAENGVTVDYFVGPS